MLSEHSRSNFETLKRAFEDGNACLLECTDKKSGKAVAVICAIQNSGDNKLPLELVPFAKMFDDNPYEEVDPPEEESDG